MFTPEYWESIKETNENSCQINKYEKRNWIYIRAKISAAQL